MSREIAGSVCGKCHRNEQECARSYPCCVDCRHLFGEGDTTEHLFVPETASPAVQRAREARRLALVNADPDYLPDDLISAALRVVEAVRTRTAGTVQAELNACTRDELYGVAVCLAAMVPEGVSPAELLAWNDARFSPAPVLRPHGTHAAYVRHKNRRQEPCEACVLGERIYQRNRIRRPKASTVCGRPDVTVESMNPAPVVPAMDNGEVA